MYAVYYEKQLTICEQMISVYSRICVTLCRSGLEITFYISSNSGVISFAKNW